MAQRFLLVPQVIVHTMQMERQQAVDSIQVNIQPDADRCSDDSKIVDCSDEEKEKR